MELLAYIQEEFVPSDDAIANDSNVSTSANIESVFQGWLKKLTTKSVKLSLNVILAGTTVLIGLGSTLNAIAEVAPEQSTPSVVKPSAEVKYVQSLLARNGFDPGAIDGVAGASTKNAIIRAQQAFGLTPDGIAGSQTISALENGGTNSTKTDGSQSVTTLPSSSTVMNLQKLLADRGFYNGAVDGLMGNQTRLAIVAAQKAYNLTPDGVAGAQTLAALESDGKTSVISSTSTSTTTTPSTEVSNLQELLKKRGFYNGAADGLLGPRTKEAIVAAQKNYGLATDGIAGAQTIAALESGSSKVNISDKNSTVTTTTDTKSANVSEPSVVALQDLLAKRGFYNGTVDGIKGARTSAAIVAAQKAYGLTPDGIAGAQTLAALQKDAKPAVTVKPNNNSAAAQPVKPVSSVNEDGVANLQNLLADRGFYKGPITGFLGARTKEAIIAAQKAYGLTADGVAGARTIAALESGAPRQQIAMSNPTPKITPVIRVIPTPQSLPKPIPQPELQPQIRVQPQAAAGTQPTVQPQASPKPQVQPTATTPIPAVTPVVVTPSPTPVAVATPIQKPSVTPAAAQSSPSTSASDAQVLELQNLLAKRGFYNGKIDGVLSGETRNAIVRAQNFYTLSPADGSPSNKLIDSLSKDTFISEGN